ncbi:hypothetical protein MTP99_008399 [Tenebrio molitor]|nr:hypothetical protein MTP99_008399 [Tenebrio molitor]
MPHVSSSGGDDLGSTDEVKVFKDEGDGEDEKRSSENLTEEKSSLIDLTESEEKSGSYSSNKNVSRADHSPVFGKVEPVPHTSSFNMGYLVSPYSYANGAAGPIPVSMEFLKEVGSRPICPVGRRRVPPSTHDLARQHGATAHLTPSASVPECRRTFFVDGLISNHSTVPFILHSPRRDSLLSTMTFPLFLTDMSGIMSTNAAA